MTVCEKKYSLALLVSLSSILSSLRICDGGATLVTNSYGSSTGCYTGWVANGDFCYYAVNTPYSCLDAQASGSCGISPLTGIYGKMASIWTADEMAFITSYLNSQSTTTTEWYVGWRGEAKYLYPAYSNVTTKWTWLDSAIPGTSSYEVATFGNLMNSSTMLPYLAQYPSATLTMCATVTTTASVQTFSTVDNHMAGYICKSRKPSAIYEMIRPDQSDLNAGVSQVERLMVNGGGARGAYFRLMTDPSAALAGVNTQERIMELYGRPELCAMRCLFSPNCIYAIIICPSSTKRTTSCMTTNNGCTLIDGP